MIAKLAAWEEPIRMNTNLDQGWNPHFSSNVGQPTYQQKQEWLALQARERLAKLREQEQEDR